MKSDTLARKDVYIFDASCTLVVIISEIVVHLHVCKWCIVEMSCVVFRTSNLFLRVPL